MNDTPSFLELALRRKSVSSNVRSGENLWKASVIILELRYVEPERVGRYTGLELHGTHEYLPTEGWLVWDHHQKTVENSFREYDSFYLLSKIGMLRPNKHARASRSANRFLIAQLAQTTNVYKFLLTTSSIVLRRYEWADWLLWGPILKPASPPPPLSQNPYNSPNLARSNK